MAALTYDAAWAAKALELHNGQHHDVFCICRSLESAMAEIERLEDNTVQVVGDVLEKLDEARAALARKNAALEVVVQDYDERVAAYGESEKMPHRVVVMEAARKEAKG